MSHFIRLLAEVDKANALLDICTRLRRGDTDASHFELAPECFDAIPGKSFGYWVSDEVRGMYRQFPTFEAPGRSVRQGLATAKDFRFVRAWWEANSEKWVGFAKGGAWSPYYADIHLLVNWSHGGDELDAFAASVVRNPDCYFRPGLTWSRRTQGGLSLRSLPAGCIFADKGPAVLIASDDSEEPLALLAITNTQAFRLLVSPQMAFGSYEVGVIQRTPIPDMPSETRSQLAALARRAWSLKRKLDTTTESSHAFVLPAVLRARLDEYNPMAIEVEFTEIQAEIDTIVFDLYGFSEADRRAASRPEDTANIGNVEDDEEADEEDEPEVSSRDALLSWAVGVAFGRFDWRLANGERQAPLEPGPFDPLSARSAGMLPEGVEPFHSHSGILVDDQGHPHDLARLVEEILSLVNIAATDDVRPWLQKDFFAFHLQRYSKSRRKAPIYWPLATASGRYTLWLYYPSLTSQTLYTAINDFIEPKLKQLGSDVATLRGKGAARTRNDEENFEDLQAFEFELIELRDTLLKIAPGYRPHNDDGVQITAAPLWTLFRHKPWQKVLKDTWIKLENGEYNWAHLAMSYWPERVRKQCERDKSLAIAHGLDELYLAPEAIPKKTRSQRNKAENG
jgi:hypothetical protein